MILPFSLILLQLEAVTYGSCFSNQRSALDHIAMYSHSLQTRVKRCKWLECHFAFSWLFEAELAFQRFYHKKRKYPFQHAHDRLASNICEHRDLHPKENDIKQELASWHNVQHQCQLDKTGGRSSHEVLPSRTCHLYLLSALNATAHPISGGSSNFFCWEDPSRGEPSKLLLRTPLTSSVSTGRGQSEKWMGGRSHSPLSSIAPN